MNDLFAKDPAVVFHGYLTAFHAWCEFMRQRGKVAADGAFGVYEHMWVAFARDMAERADPVPIEHLALADLQTFIDARSGRDSVAPSARYVWRLLHLIDRVLAHTARLAGRVPSPVAMDLLGTRKEWLYANARGREDLPDYLTPDQARRLIKYLASIRPQPGRSGQLVGWQELRTSAAVALQLGAGLTPAEVRALTLSAPVGGGRVVDVPWKLRVPAVGSAKAREAPLATWGGFILKRWLEVRRELGIPGEWLFPSTRSKGTPWGKIGHYEASRALLLASGWTEEEAKGGSFRLRHTFALRQLGRGADEAEVARWLGIEPEAMRKYRDVLYEPVLDLA